MSQQKPTQTGGPGDERVKQELRNLRKIQAPWYFESRLQQRLRRTDEPRSWVTRPVPAFALSMLALALVGAVGYHFYFNPDFVSPPSQTEEPRREQQAVQPAGAPAPLQQDAAPIVVPESAGGRHQGPSESGEQSTRSTVRQRFETAPRAAEVVSTKPPDAASSQERGSMTSRGPDTALRQPLLAPETRVSGVATLRDSTKVVDTSSARKDTTKVRHDTLQRIPDRNPPK